MTSPERSRAMRAVKSEDTSAELKVRRLLSGLGFRYRLHRRDLPGVPDIVFPGRQKCIFVHGCFWHQHSCTRGNRQPKTNVDYWKRKLERNRHRDESHLQMLTKCGWRTLVLWECELRDVTSLEAKLLEFLR